MVMTVSRAALIGALVASNVLAVAAPAAPRLAKASSGQQLQQQTMNDVPHCTRKLGTASIADGDDPSAWSQWSLQAPSKLLKVLIQRSGCFNIVERGAGLAAAQRERDIGNDLGLQRGSNVGQGQIKAADYVILAEIQGANSNVSGNAVGAAAGGGGFWGSGAAAAGVGSYASTDIGRIVTLSFIQAYSKLVTSLGLVGEGSAGTAEAAPKKTYSTMGPVVMRKVADASGAAIRTLPPGAILYPTGKQNGLWWEVADENDNVGWVLNTKLQPSR